MHRTVRDLMSDLIDYAGLFPPAGLGMDGAVKGYSRYLASPYAWMLGRFVVPVPKLTEFEKAKSSDHCESERPWRLSALVGADPEADRRVIEGFNASQAGQAMIDAIEIKADHPEAIQLVAKQFSSDTVAYIEIPIANDPTNLINAISDFGLRAKVRTGAVTADGFPSLEHVGRFIETCNRKKVAFKATAGLHHPLRNVYRLTYEPDSPTGLMHGFLNVFVSAAFARQGMTGERLVEILEEQSPVAFRFSDSGVEWRGETLSAGVLKECREQLAISFGSCSFEEPVSDLKMMGLL
jgi:hypothetical protein